MSTKTMTIEVSAARNVLNAHRLEAVETMRRRCITAQESLKVILREILGHQVDARVGSSAAALREAASAIDTAATVLHALNEAIGMLERGGG